jgi:hypothetical protein
MDLRVKQRLASSPPRRNVGIATLSPDALPSRAFEIISALSSSGHLGVCAEINSATAREPEQVGFTADRDDHRVFPTIPLRAM